MTRGNRADTASDRRERGRAADHRLELLRDTSRLLFVAIDAQRAVPAPTILANQVNHHAAGEAEGRSICRACAWKSIELLFSTHGPRLDPAAPAPPTPDSRPDPDRDVRESTSRTRAQRFPHPSEID